MRRQPQPESSLVSVVAAGAPPVPLLVLVELPPVPLLVLPPVPLELAELPPAPPVPPPPSE